MPVMLTDWKNWEKSTVGEYELYLSNSSWVVIGPIHKLYFCNHITHGHQEMLRGVTLWVSERGLAAPDWEVTLLSL